MKKVLCLLFCSIILSFCVLKIFSQKQTEAVRAAEAVKKFYRFQTTHDDSFTEKQVALRTKFFTPKLRIYFNSELLRQKNYLKKYPGNKPYFEGLPFQPIEFCPKDYSVGKARVNKSDADVRVNFIYSKTNCQSNDGTKIFYTIKLVKISNQWLIDNVIFDDDKDLISAFKIASKIK